MKKRTVTPPYLHRAVRMWLRAYRTGDKGKERNLLQSAIWQVRDYLDKRDEVAIGERE